MSVAMVFVLMLHLVMYGACNDFAKLFCFDVAMGLGRAFDVIILVPIFQLFKIKIIRNHLTNVFVSIFSRRKGTLTDARDGGGKQPPQITTNHTNSSYENCSHF